MADLLLTDIVAMQAIENESIGSFPVRISVTTFNVWGDNNWPARADALASSLLSMWSDVYLLQEITPAIVEHLDKSIGADYERIDPTQGDKKEQSAGWLSESNIFWKKDLFELVDHGHGDLEIDDHPERCLFWARLSVKSNPKVTFFVSTAHFPWVGCPKELETGMNQRIPAALRVCEHFRRIVSVNECAIFGGDLNDDFHPVRILSEEVGLMDVFESLDLPPPITHPVRPSSLQEEMRPNRTLDWLLCSMPSPCRVVAAFAKQTRGGTYPPVSDHLPVVAVFEIC